MPPRRRQDAAQTAEAYNYASAEKLNNPTGETALGMQPQDLADQPIPDLEEEERLGIRVSSGTGESRPTIPGPSARSTSTTRCLQSNS